MSQTQQSCQYVVKSDDLVDVWVLVVAIYLYLYE